MIVKTDCETDGTLHSTNFNTVPGPRLSVIIVWSGSCPLDVSMCGGAGAGRGRGRPWRLLWCPLGGPSQVWRVQSPAAARARRSLSSPLPGEHSAILRLYRSHIVAILWSYISHIMAILWSYRSHIEAIL